LIQELLWKKKKDKISKLTQVGKRIAIKKLILIPLLPILAVPYTMWNISNAIFFGSNYNKVYLVIIQLLFFRILLAAHDITIESFGE